MSKKKKPAKKTTPPPAMPPELKSACAEIVDDIFAEVEGKCFAQIAVLNHRISQLEERLSAVESKTSSQTKTWWSLVKKSKSADLPG